MRIALINYEYPPDTADGGIATYAAQAARMLNGRGHDIEVFAGSRTEASSKIIDGIRIHRVLETDIVRFAETIAPVFARRHEQVGFDVMEGPDFMADAREAARLTPDVPLVVKLHTPNFKLQRAEATSESPKYRWKAMIEHALRGRLPAWHPRHAKNRAERDHVRAADEVAASSQAIARLVVDEWGVKRDRISIFPLPFTPARELLEVPIVTSTRTVTFIGRLQVLKGALILGRAIPLVLQRHPDVTFRLIGRSLDSPVSKMSMQEYLRDRLKDFGDSVRFEGPIPHSGLAKVLSGSDICVFPSIWESFGLACLEAMSAGRGVVVPGGHGLEEVVDGGRCGVVVQPRSPQALAEGIIRLLENPGLRMKLGGAARQHVISACSDETVGAQQEASYRRAISRHYRRAGISARVSVPARAAVGLAS